MTVRTLDFDTHLKEYWPMRILIILFAALLLASCRHTFTPGVDPYMNLTSLEPQEAWSRLLQWISDKGGHVTRSDEASYTLWADVPIVISGRDASAYVNCGDGHGWTNEAAPVAQFQARVGSYGPGEGWIFVSALYDKSKFAPTNGVPPWHCLTTGKMETEVLAVFPPKIKANP